MSSSIPVLLLTGYLGSGKTTLVNRILANQRGIRFAVIVNDIGEVNIDADLIAKDGVVRQADENLVPLQNGCICCTLKMDLVEQLHDLCTAGRFDYIVIEASGICEPAPIAQTICTMPRLVPAYARDPQPRLDCITTVVDALRLRDEFHAGRDLLRQGLDDDDLENLVIQQVEFCNMILLNKASELSPAELAEVREILHALQPRAEIVECDYCDVDLTTLLHTALFDFEAVATSAAWIAAIEDDDDCEGETEEYGIGTYVYQSRRPMRLGLFDEFVARQWPKSIIRAKGICYFEGERDTCYLFEQAGRQVSLKNVGQWFATMPKDELEAMMERDAHLRRDWDPEYGDRMQKLVFIGQHLDREALRTALDHCLC